MAPRPVRPKVFWRWREPEGSVRELIVHRNDIVFYRLLAATGTVEILRVKHAAQRLP
jgi:plasmid stabilization system protein ParE